MTDFWCWLVGCGAHHAHDAANAAPEISIDGALSALVLLVGVLLVVAVRRPKRAA